MTLIASIYYYIVTITLLFRVKIEAIKVIEPFHLATNLGLTLVDYLAVQYHFNEVSRVAINLFTSYLYLEMVYKC